MKQINLKAVKVNSSTKEAAAKTATNKQPAKVAKAAPRYTAETSMYQDKYPTITLTDTAARNPKYASFSFGLNKAKMILGSIEAIEAFVEENTKDTD